MQRKYVRAAAIGAVLLTATALLLIWVPQLRHLEITAQVDEKAASESMAMPASMPMNARSNSTAIRWDCRTPRPTPKKDSMGMDYIPVYDGEDTR